MKKTIRIAFLFALAGALAGVYYREFTKALGVTAQYTVLGQVHPHLLGLGCFGTLIIALMNERICTDAKANARACRLYFIGTAGMSAMLLVRGTLDALQRGGATGALGRGLDASISGIAGIFHLLVAWGIIRLFLLWMKGEEVRK